MDNIVGSGLLAVIAGAVVAVLAFVPFVAISYRRRGRLTLGRSLLWVGAAVYFWAIWTYTLIPVPETEVVATPPTTIAVAWPAASPTSSRTWPARASRCAVPGRAFDSAGPHAARRARRRSCLVMRISCGFGR